MIILKVLGFFKYIEIKKKYDVFYAKVSKLSLNFDNFSVVLVTQMTLISYSTVNCQLSTVNCQLAKVAIYLLPNHR